MIEAARKAASFHFGGRITIVKRSGGLSKPSHLRVIRKSLRGRVRRIALDVVQAMQEVERADDRKALAVDARLIDPGRQISVEFREGGRLFRRIGRGR